MQDDARVAADVRNSLCIFTFTCILYLHFLSHMLNRKSKAKLQYAISLSELFQVLSEKQGWIGLYDLTVLCLSSKIIMLPHTKDRSTLVQMGDWLN